MRYIKEILVGGCLLLSSVSLAQQPASKAAASGEKKNAPAATKQKAQPQQAQPAAQAGGTMESQPGSMPTSAPGDTYEQNPIESQQMACELHKLIKAAEAKAGANESAEMRASREALIVSQKRELKGALSVYKKVTGQALNLETSCQ